MSLSARMDLLLKQKGWSQAELARRVGISTQAVWKLVSGGAASSKHLHKIARELDTTAEYLVGETDDSVQNGGRVGLPSSDSSSRPDIEDWASDHGLVPVRQIDLAFGMGATYLDQPVSEVAHFFPEEWLREFTSSPASMLFFAKGVGDSMLPTLSPNDTMIIDCSEKRLTMSDQIWAVTYCGLGMVKRLRPTKDGGIRILSDNPLVPEEVAYDGELNLIGRVVAVMRKI